MNSWSIGETADMRYVSELVNRIRTYPRVAVFGARIVAREVAAVLMSDPYRFEITCFMVFDTKHNPESIMGLPVRNVDDVSDEFKDGLIIVASMEKSLAGIMEDLYRHGFLNILPFTFESDLWSEARGNAYEYWYNSMFHKPYLDIDSELVSRNRVGPVGELHVYRAVSSRDRIIYGNINEFTWEIPIHAGKVLSDESLCALNDADGEDNISSKNPRFCELTALYWIWKNDICRYKGLCHYRRHFALDEEKRKMITGSDIDVILPIPVFNEPDVLSVYSADHFKEDWFIMMEELNRLAPEYTETAQKLARSSWYYAYNMLIAKEAVFDDYCSFLFPILFSCEKRIGQREDPYQGRYAGFLAERLMTVYFMKHKEYKIVHCRKRFIRC